MRAGPRWAGGGGRVVVRAAAAAAECDSGERRVLSPWLRLCLSHTPHINAGHHHPPFLPHSPMAIYIKHKIFRSAPSPQNIMNGYHYIKVFSLKHLTPFYAPSVKT